MRLIIWNKGDFFTTGEGRVDMDAEVVKLPTERIPLTWGFFGSPPPLGWVTDIRCVDGTIDGEFEFTDKALIENWDEVKKFARLGGYYKMVEFTDSDRIRVASCELRAVSFVLNSAHPNPGARMTR